MSRKKEFLMNTIILAFGKISTQLISFLFIPIYTNYLLVDDYGLIDLYQTLITMLIPFVNIRLDVVAFKFLSICRDDVEKKNETLRNIFMLLIFSVFISLVFGVFISVFLNIKYFWFVLINLIITSVSIVFLQILRGLKYNKEYSICCIITSIISLVLTILFIVILKMDAKSILIISSISNLFCILYCIIKIKPKINYRFKIFNGETKKMLKFSLPMILDASSWWIVSASDRAIISTFLGVSFNGIYSISCKFSNILNSLFLIFNMSWQESIVAHMKDNDSGQFISKLGNEIIKFFLVISLLIIILLPFIFDIFIGIDYLDSYYYIPLLLYANIFSVISTLIGSILVVYGITKEIAKTTFISAILNVFINLVFIKFIGLYAAAISTFISYFVISIFRYFKVKKYVNFNLDYKMIIKYFFVLLISSILYIFDNNIFSILNLFISLIFILLSNKKIIFEFIFFLRKKIHL